MVVHHLFTLRCQIWKLFFRWLSVVIQIFSKNFRKLMFFVLAFCKFCIEIQYSIFKMIFEYFEKVLSFEIFVLYDPLANLSFWSIKKCAKAQSYPIFIRKLSSLHMTATMTLWWFPGMFFYNNDIKIFWN